MKKTSKFEAEIKIKGKKYLSSGSDVREALFNLKVIGNSKVTSVLSLWKDGEAVKCRVLHPLQTCRLFSPSPLTREIAIKNISMFF